MVTRGSFSMNNHRRTVQRFRQLIGPLKTKLLFFCIIAFTSFLLLSSGASFFLESPDRPSLSLSSVKSRNGYAILMNTWKRNDLLKKSISHYATCPGLHSIHIVWSEPDPPSHSLLQFLNHVVKKKNSGVELKFDINHEDSLNNRFKEIKDLSVDAVFSIDDDVIFPCSTVKFAFDVWRSASDTMVGFVPRKVTLQELQGGKNQYIYSGWWSVWWTGTYSMVLSKAAFFHKKYLRIYTKEMPASIRQYVTKNRNCEDIAMSFLVANVSAAPPIWAKGNIYEIGSTGISSLGGHTEKRTECVNRFVAEFGQMPLITTSVKAVDSRHEWLW